MSDRRKALDGVKVADFSWFISGPLVAKFLGDCGAEVIHIESVTKPDNMRSTLPMKDNVPGINRSAAFARYNSSKYGISLNLGHPMGADIALRLVAWADVVVENFSSGTMERLGLGYEELKKVNPAIIVVSLPMFGHSGPLAKHPGLGSQLADLTGFGNLTGWPDRPPVSPPGAYTDFISPYYAIAALMAALDYRHRTGKGQYIEVSQYEAGVQFVAPLVMDWFVHGREPPRTGNECPGVAPHGVYRCLGEERWCAIAAFTEEEWRSLCEAMGMPDLACDPRFVTVMARLHNHVELDALIENWTAKHTAEEVMMSLQKAGVAAGVVCNGRDQNEDPHLNGRGFYKELEHSEIGRHRYLMPPFRLSKTPPELNLPAPCLGQHNEYVYRQILGMSDEEFIGLLNEGVFD
ncbi:MAG: CoA transferase [Dehalococcoidia bacterium]|nr:CoA transferase [Dehalococcoidia bacterium]